MKTKTGKTTMKGDLVKIVKSKNQGCGIYWEIVETRIMGKNPKKAKGGFLQVLETFKM